MGYKRQPLTCAEVEKMKAACKTPRETAIVGITTETGVRLHELVKMREEDVNWAEARLTVLGKGRVMRVLPLSDEAMRCIKLWFTDPVKARQVQYIFSALGERAGIERRVHVHLARHFFAVHCLKRGISLRAIQLLLAHKSLQTTSQYLSLSPDDVINEWREKWN